VAGNLVFNTLSVGWEHVCGVTAGRVYCWGSNSHGQLGTGGTEVLRSVPTPVAGSERYDSVAAGGRHTCALASGKALCWGDDSFGQLGDGRTGKFAPAAVAVAGDLRFLAVSAGTDHTCAITSGGALYCWGRNDTGQLGDGSLTDSSVPQLVTVGAVPELLRFPSR
jgi:alpha-tubulin suppressor-like RCC1 family protein